jgi:hypothetical protein
MDIDCIYLTLYGGCRLSQGICNYIQHLTCFYEKTEPVKEEKEQKKTEEASE